MRDTLKMQLIILILVSEDESAISTDIIRKQEIGYQSSSLSVQKHQSTLSIPKTRLKPMR